MAIAQDLLGAPQCIRVARRAHPQQAFGCQSPFTQGGNLWQVGRLQERDATLPQGLQRRLQKSHLADTWLLLQQLDQPAMRPAPVGQFPVQRRMAG